MDSQNERRAVLTALDVRPVMTRRFPGVDLVKPGRVPTYLTSLTSWGWPRDAPVMTCLQRLNLCVTDGLRSTSVNDADVRVMLPMESYLGWHRACRYVGSTAVFIGKVGSLLDAVENDDELRRIMDEFIGSLHAAKKK
jgi:hypothetical protein